MAEALVAQRNILAAPRLRQKLISFSVSLCVLGFEAGALAAGRFGELILAFKEKKFITIQENPKAHALILDFAQTSYQELAALENYDEALIKRLTIKDMGAEGTRVSLVLRDANLRAAVDLLEEPFRVHLSFFDQDYRQELDPVTGLPLLKFTPRGPEAAALTPTSSSASAAPLLSSGKASSDLAAAPQTEAPKLEPASAPLKFVAAAPLARSASPTPASGFQRKLLLPTPARINSADELGKTLAQTGEGRGAAWRDFPYYLYPLATAAYAGREKPAGWEKKVLQSAMNDAQSLAEFAYKMFSFGNEKQALVLYQQVLFSDPTVFDKDALHLWGLAESHLGQGNLSLADGYFEALAARFPESALAPLASLRRLDIQALNLLAEHKPDSLTSLTPALGELAKVEQGELQAQVAIRRAYWSAPSLADLRTQLPSATPAVYEALEAVLAQVESKKTAFLATSIILKNKLNPELAWTGATAQLVEAYFATYDENSGQPFYSDLHAAMQRVLAQTLIRHSQAEAYQDCLTTYEKLSPALQAIKDQPSVAWALAEAYRAVGRDDSALSFYHRAARKLAKGPQQFQSYFWEAVLAGRLAERNKSEKGESAQAKKYAQQAHTADQKMGLAWQSLAEQEQNQVRVAYQRHLEASLADKTLLRTPAQLILSSWQVALGSGMNLGDDQAKLQAQNFSPTAATVLLLRDLVQRFRDLGLDNERRRAASLLQQIKPQAFVADKTAQQVWTEQLVSLADEYREDNQYLEAGRLFAFVAKQSPNWEQRAEAFYKGGLLLYRAGKRQEAIEVLTLASQDGNNLFYANLAKERLTQLKS